ncbi:MAG: glutamine synthetase [Lachnospiraceae bacterium]|nr:glutamine synthetase [Lachnospiraceae bacterium]
MRENYSKDDIMRLVEEEDVEFIRLQFTDILGNLKNIAITSSQLQKALNNRCTFDCASIAGFEGCEEGELLLIPDPSTLAIFPWRPQQGKVARMICDVYNLDGTPFAGDSRYVLKKAIAKAAEMGYSFEVGQESEFFLFHTDDNTLPTTITHEQAGYFDCSPLDFGENARRDMVLTLEDMGFEIESSHHEAARAQHEIKFKSDEVLATADNILTFRLAVKTIAKRHGLHATFMPKPKEDENGSGMHIRMVLKKDGKNIFTDKNDKYGLSKEAYCFIGGLLRYVKGMAAITNPLVNSYKRLVPGGEVPMNIGWGMRAKNKVVCVYKDLDGEISIELRSPDPAANPYLTLAVCLQAGMEGICQKLLPGDEVQGTMPESLTAAVAYMEQEKEFFTNGIVGEYLFDKYVAKKKEEWSRYRKVVTAWEVDEYLYKY